MPSFGIPQGRYGSQGTISNFHTVFGVGGGGETSTPPLLDLSEFPSLTNRAGQGDSMPQPSPMPGKQPYGECSSYMHVFGFSMPVQEESNTGALFVWEGISYCHIPYSSQAISSNLTLNVLWSQYKSS
jgi:hypothetical protein